jgi:hypothetical protein
MRASLLDPDLKRQWAKKHLDSLAAEIATFKSLHKPNITVEDDLLNGWHLIHVEIPHNERVFQIALTAGDFISSLRASLDHLAWQLALLSGIDPSKDICFPICAVDNASARKYIRKSTCGMPPEAIRIIESMQPYHDNQPPQTHLWRLHTLWNIEKHRHIAAHRVVTGWVIKCEGGTNLSGYAADKGVVYRVPIGEKNRVELNPNLSDFEIRFTDNRLGIDIDFTDFNRIYDFMTDNVIPAFSGLFR